MCLPSVAPVQLGYCHSEQNYSVSFFPSVSVGCDNSVGDNLLQIASQVDIIVECTAEGALLEVKLTDIWEFPEVRNLKINTTTYNK